jgi:hypothetical protein
MSFTDGRKQSASRVTVYILTLSVEDELTKQSNAVSNAKEYIVLPKIYNLVTYSRKSNRVLQNRTVEAIFYT